MTFLHTRALVMFYHILLASLLVQPARSQAQYDYIVVGSGPGGGPLAVNLAKAGHSVLLLEAGDTSVAQGSGQYPSSITWDFFVKHYEDDARNVRNNQVTWRLPDGRYWTGNKNVPAGAQLLGIYYPRGATVGGSSMINAMATQLPTDSDWDYIVNLTNDTSWSAANMRNIFVRIEKNNYLPVGTPGHGFNGWFQTHIAPTFGGITGVVGDVLRAMATLLGQDPNQITQYASRDNNQLSSTRDREVGIYGLARHTRSNGQRYSSRDYVIESMNAGSLPLTLSQNSLATKILFNTSGSKPRATGVEYRVGRSLYKADARYNGARGELRTATARREVILAGGAFNSPQLLKLSGIGPSDELRRFNIPVLADLPGVGINMQDNQEMPVVGRPQGTASGFGSGGFVMYQTDHAPYGERDVFLMHGPYAFRGFWPDSQANTGLNAGDRGIYGVSIVKQHPQNRAGTVRLRSSDPTDPPDINFNLFKEKREIDMGGMKDTVAWVRRVFASTRSPSGPVTPLEPPCGQVLATGYCRDQAVDERWIEDQTFGHHPTNTCAIGADGDRNAVLDSKFRVRGVEGLRVVDASVFPRIPGVFPVVATFMVSQKASDDIIAGV
ncbi:hypothetical protein D7B24_006377 [Verticillium nonalfalfae]|uniref:Glucose-methanol-choline oxidoreductase N-terminal domain-containing protein n=1 Tax=Verticillium nonalfalfae TaxID=1051616 RepID=A0A3M9YAV3_9PEZI|nr:uncharacterized protein D7B24_006377 [Verticillium nonalfalfae]RNJ57102.1 hypothetical protein D7B24_006377 [Verticillium nonalfalfae]